MIAGYSAEAEPRVTSRGDAESHEDGTHGYPHEEREDVQRGLLHAFRDLAEEREDDNGGAVVDERFALYDVSQSFGRANLFEQRDDGDGIGGGEDGTEHEARGPSPSVRQRDLEEGAHEGGA